MDENPIFCSIPSRSSKCPMAFKTYAFFSLTCVPYSLTIVKAPFSINGVTWSLNFSIEVSRDEESRFIVTAMAGVDVEVFGPTTTISGVDDETWSGVWTSQPAGEVNDIPNLTGVIAIPFFLFYFSD